MTYRLVRAKVEASIELAAQGDEWWKSLTKKQQEAYVKLHPNSKYAKKTKIGKDREKLIKGVGKKQGDKNGASNLAKRRLEMEKERLRSIKAEIKDIDDDVNSFIPKYIREQETRKKKYEAKGDKGGDKPYP